MNAAHLEKRVENLENACQSLADLPGRATALESQVLQLRTEMRDAFSAIRAEYATKKDLERLATNERLDAVAHELRTQMLVLHEDLVERIKLLGEALENRRRRRKR